MKSFLSYLGGKSRLVSRLLPLIPPHETYVEPCAGAAWLFFAREEPSKAEVLNDANSELVTLYRCVQNHLEEFVRCFRWSLVARDEFRRMVDERPHTMTDIQRAVRYYYILRTAFGSKIARPSFGTRVGRPPGLNLLRIEEELSAVHLRLARVYIENLHYAELVRRYDRPGTFFYIDPPYWGCEDDYGKGLFDRSDFSRLSAILSQIEGKFLLSINDVPEVRELFDGFRVKGISTTYTTASRSNSIQARELLVANYDI